MSWFAAFMLKGIEYVSFWQLQQQLPECLSKITMNSRRSVEDDIYL